MNEQRSALASSTDPVTLDDEFAASRSVPGSGGPAEGLDDHHCNGHFAQIYETDAERFAAAVPFVRRGLEQDERVMYVLDEGSETAVLAALDEAGVDVAAALDSGALSFHPVQDTYLQDGSFEADDVAEFYADSVAAATGEYEALRIVAETTWLQEDATSVEQFMEYEAKVNDLLGDEDCLALCQYDRDGFPPAVIKQIVRTHPHLVYDGEVCHNFYYTPPGEFLGDDDPAREVDRMLGTLRERTAAKAELRRRDQFLQDLHDIVADRSRSFEEKLHALLDLGREQFDLAVGGLNRVDPDADRFEVEYLSGDHEHFEPGLELPLSHTYCQAAADIEEAAMVSNPAGEEFEDLPVFEKFGVQGYLGTYIPVDGGEDRTLGFLPAEGEPVSFSEADRTYLELMGQWVGYELDRRQHEQFLRECYEITSDPGLEFEEKLHALFDLGCEQFDLELGGMATVDPDADRFEVEYLSGDHEHFEPGLELPLSETYCTAATDAGGVGSVDDPVEAGYDDIHVHSEFGIETYLGTYIEVEEAPNRTFFFVSEEPRDGTFSDDERTFQRLLGQWVKYELERRQRERELRERKEHLGALVETTPECIKTVAADGTLLQMNSAGLDMAEVDAGSDVIGESVYDLIAPEDRERFREFNERICRGERGTLEFDIVGLEGTRRHMETHAAPLHHADGTVSHVAVTRDVTDRREREERLREKKNRLESFASMLAHELRNPVAIGQIYGQQLPEEAGSEAVEYVTEAFDRIEDMIDVMLVLTQGQKAVDEGAPVALADVAREAWDDVDGPQADLEVEVDGTVEADETYVRHLFQNLLENAVEHGGSAVTVTVGGLPDGFYVADDGTGIPSGDRDVIFDEGYTTAAGNGGTGLGLAFVEKLADVYRWDCYVTESEDGGARFEFRNVG